MNNCSYEVQSISGETKMVEIREIKEKKENNFPTNFITGGMHNILRETGNLVLDTVEYAADLTRGDDNDEIENDDPFALDNKIVDEFGTGNVKLYLKNRNRTSSTISRLMKDDPSLVELTIRFIKFTQKEINQLSLALKRNKSLKKLIFYKNEIGDQNAQVLANGIMENFGLEELTFYQNSLTGKGACLLCNAIGKCATIESFSFFRNRLGVDGMDYIRQAFKENSNISSIDLFQNGMGHEGAIIMADILQHNKYIESLSISHNDIGTVGVCAIAEEMKKQEILTRLELSGNGICKEGALYIAQALQECSSIKTLDLSGNDISDDGCIAIIKQLVFKKYPITELDLSYNNLSEGGAQCILKLLHQNTSLKCLKLKEENLNNEAIGKQVRDLIQQNEVISHHHKGIETFGPFYYITVEGSMDKDSASNKLKLAWTDKAWQAAEISGSTIALLHEILLILVNLANNTSSHDQCDHSKDKSELFLKKDLKSCYIASLHSGKYGESNSVTHISADSSRLKTEMLECYRKDAHSLSNFVLQSCYDVENIKRLVMDCKDDNGNTILSIVKKNKNEESFKFIKFIIQTFSLMGKDRNAGDADQVSYGALTSLNTVDDITQWGDNSKLAIGRYNLEHYPERPKYVSDSCSIYSGVDVKVDPWDANRNVTLKFYHKKEDFEKELSHYVTSWTEIISGEDITLEDQENKFDETYILPIIRFHTDHFCLVLPLGDRNLDEIISNEAKVEHDLFSIRSLMRSMAMSLRHLHEDHKMIHGNIKPRNFVRHNGTMKLVDFQEATLLNTAFESHKSTGYIAPELAIKLFSFQDSKDLSHWANEEKKIMKKLVVLDRTNDEHQGDIQVLEHQFDGVRAHIRRNSLSSNESFNVSNDTIVASRMLDIWSFGVTSYYLLSGSQLFTCDQYDNLYTSDRNEQDKILLWNGMDEVYASRIQFSSENSLQQHNAIDLLRRCLHPDQKLRFSNMNRVLNHAFFVDDAVESSEMNEAKVDKELTDAVDTFSPVQTITYKPMRNSCHSAISNVSNPDIKNIDTEIHDEIYSSPDLPHVELEGTIRESFLDKLKKKVCL